MSAVKVKVTRAGAQCFRWRPRSVSTQHRLIRMYVSSQMRHAAVALSRSAQGLKWVNAFRSAAQFLRKYVFFMILQLQRTERSL